MQAATGGSEANGCWATSVFPCDMNIFRPHDFPLASGNITAASVNHHAVVKTSYQPSFCSFHFSMFISADALRSIIRYQPCAKPELNPNPDGLRRMLFLVLQKIRKGRVWQDPTPSDTPSDSGTEVDVPVTDDSTEEDER
jgi:hypothetical protein